MFFTSLSPSRQLRGSRRKDVPVQPQHRSTQTSCQRRSATTNASAVTASVRILSQYRPWLWGEPSARSSIFGIRERRPQALILTRAITPWSSFRMAKDLGAVLQIWCLAQTQGRYSHIMDFDQPANQSIRTSTSRPSGTVAGYQPRPAPANSGGGLLVPSWFAVLNDCPNASVRSLIVGSPCCAGGSARPLGTRRRCAATPAARRRLARDLKAPVHRAPALGQRPPSKP